jgi:dihydrodipicolinate synthase/N-acetylneuraminate lyase
VRGPSPEAGKRASDLRSELQRFPFHAATKAALGFRGVPVGPEVRAPLRGLTEGERAEVERIVAAWQG